MNWLSVPHAFCATKVATCMPAPKALFCAWAKSRFKQFLNAFSWFEEGACVMDLLMHFAVNVFIEAVGLPIWASAT